MSRIPVFLAVLSATCIVTLHAQRPTVLRQATSTSEIWNASDCTRYRTVNRAYQVLAVRLGPSRQEDRLAQESETQDWATCTEGVAGSVELRLWPVADTTTAPLVLIRSPGTEGEPFLPDELWRSADFVPLYRIREVACCGVQSLDHYFSLRTGAEVFRGNLPLQYFFANGTIRYASVVSHWSARELPEVNAEPRTIAVFEYGTGVRAPQRVLLLGESDGRYLLQNVHLVQEGSTRQPIILVRQYAARDSVAVSGVSIVAELSDAVNGGTVTVSIPVSRDRLDPARAHVPSRFSLRVLQ